MMESAKLVINGEEFEVFLCEDCGEHEGQIEAFDGMICYQCWMDREESTDREYGSDNIFFDPDS
jgi:hypothetical protein